MILFDTDTLTHFAYGNANVRRKVDEAGDGPLAVSVIPRYEILRGRAENLLKAASEEELRKAVERFNQTERLLSDFLVVGFDEDAIRRFGTLKKVKAPQENGPG